MFSRAIYRFYAYARHHFRSVISSRGYGIHSPFAFNLVTGIINNNEAYYYCFDTIEKIRHQCLNDNHRLQLKDRNETTLSKACRRSSSPDRDAQLIFKLAVLMKSRNMIELGTFLGFGTVYMASTASQARVISIDYDPAAIAQASKNVEALGLNNVEFINDTIDNALPKALQTLSEVDLIFFDANHQHNATISYFEMALPYVRKKTIFVFHDIHWSCGMYQAWRIIKDHRQVSISIECYNVGIVFFDPKYNKQHFFA